MVEIWKDIENFEGLYQVSNYGRVKSLYRNIIRKPQKHLNGYLFLMLHKENNCVENLEWVTKSENQRHAVQAGLRKTGDYVNTFNMKPVLCYRACDDSFVKEYDSTKRAAEELGLDASTITKILKNKKKTTKGYKFIYKV